MSCTLSQRATLEINLNAVVANARLAKSIFDKRKQIIAVVKANAYGLGLQQIVRALSAEVAYFAVATYNEAIELRQLTPSHGIIILASLSSSEREAAIAAGFDFFVSSIKEIEESLKFGEKLNTYPQMHLKIDTGMGRLGFYYESFAKIAAELASIPNLRFKGLATHLTHAQKVCRTDTSFLATYGVPDKDGSITLFDIPPPQIWIENKKETPIQIARFNNCRKLLQNFEFSMVHLLNSAGVIEKHEAEDNFIRPGLMLYGIHPSPSFEESQIVPALNLTSRIDIIKDLPKYATISYGSVTTLERQSRVAVVPFGYADGYPRTAHRAAYVLVKGKACAVLGVVTMDSIMIDVTDVPEAIVGDQVTIFGTNQNGTSITINQFASWVNTISWDVLTKIGSRVQRKYIEINK